MQTHLNLKSDAFVVFADETGHELLPKGHIVYGLAGCGILAQDVEQELIRPWYRLCRRLGNCKKQPLHANSFARTASARDMVRVANFFQFRRFARLGAVLSTNTRLPPGTMPIEVISGVFKNRIIDVARWTDFSSIKVIFEASQRTNKMITDAFGNTKIRENGKQIPIDFYFMSKNKAHPGLQIADFIAHAIHGQVVSRAQGRNGFRKDFESVFHKVNARLCSYCEVTEANII